MKASGILQGSGDDEIGQHVSPTNQSGSQEPKGGLIFVLCNNEIGSDINTGKEENKIPI